MRELVLNHASVAASDLETATLWLKQLALGLVSLNQLGIGKTELRMARHLHEIKCTDRATLYDVWLALRKIGAREEAQYLYRLSSKAPLLDSVGDSVKDRFTRCEATSVEDKRMTPDDGDPLLYCAVADGIAVGFPSAPAWEQDSIKVYFDELSADGEKFEETSETIDNLTRLEHADAIAERHLATMRGVSSFADMWERRAEIFPNLLFGPDVEDQLGHVNNTASSAVVKKLSTLDSDAANWRSTDTAMPEWSCKVRPESDTVRNNPSLIRARRFRSHGGGREMFEWHADFGDNRIHLRFDARTKEVEIGYIGRHLPLR